MINSFNCSVIPSDEFYTFGSRILAIFDGKTQEGTPLDLFVKSFKQTFREFEDSFKHKDRNPYTERVVMADAVRDEAFYAFRFYAEACSHCSLEGWTDAGQTIKTVIRKHGWTAAYMGYKAETAALQNLSLELRSKYMTELTLTASSDWLARMDAAQKNFEIVMAANITEMANDTSSITETRPAFTNSVRSLLSYINLQNSITSTPELTGYITRINDLIGLTLATVKANETRQANEKKKDDATTTK